MSTSSATTAATAHGARRGADGVRADGANGSGPGSAARRCPVPPEVPGAAAGRGGAGRQPAAGAPPGGVQRPGVGGPAVRGGGGGGRRTVRVTSSCGASRGATIVVSASVGGGTRVPRPAVLGPGASFAG